MNTIENAANSIPMNTIETHHLDQREAALAARRLASAAGHGSGQVLVENVIVSEFEPAFTVTAEFVALFGFETLHF